MKLPDVVRSRAMLLQAPGRRLEPIERELPAPGPGELRLRVGACGVCRTDLHLLDGELEGARYPIVPGHQVVGRVETLGAGVSEPRVGARVGVPWLGGTCGKCAQCRAGRENLCPSACFTGAGRDGGYAEHVLARAAYCLPLPERGSDPELAPLLCAGLIGYRALRMTGDAPRVGLYGFGAAAHIACQILVAQGRTAYAFTRPDDRESRAFARSLGAAWAGSSEEAPPQPLEAAVIFAPVGALVPQALRAVAPGGVVVCAGIHMSDIPSFPYRWLWGERVLRSVANLTRRDGREFFEIVARTGVRTHVECFALEDADRALAALRAGAIQGAAVLDLRTA